MSRIKPVYNITLKADDVDGLAEVVERAFNGILPSINSVAKSEIIAGSLIQDIDLDTVAVKVQHKLDRKPLGYFVVKRDAAATVYDVPDLNETIFLNLAASGPVRVSLWVF